MRKLIKTIISAAIIGIIMISAITPAFAYNSIPAGNALQPPVLEGSNTSLNGATWTPFDAYDKELFQLHPGQLKTPNMRLYPKPDGATLPPVGWNSWNAFFSSITAPIIASIADQIADKDPITGEPLNGLGLYKCGYKYVIVDDGCYASGSVLGPTANFSSFSHGGKTGFAALGQYVHDLGLKYGMYNDSGPSTCGGQPGSYPAAGGREDAFGGNLVSWGIDTLKYDWCGNPWGIQNNFWVGGGPDVQQIVISGNGYSSTTSWASSAPSNVIMGGNASRNSGGYLAGLGITSGTQMRNPTIIQGFAHVTITGVPEYGTYNLSITRRTSGGNASATGGGRFIMVDVNGKRQYESLTTHSTTFTNVGTSNIPLTLKAGTNVITLYNTKNQEIGLYCYSSIRDAMNKAGGQNASLKQCCWGNTAGWMYGHMIGESHRQYSDIFGNWNPMGSWGYTRDEHSRAIYVNDAYNLELGGSWSDPDMMVVGLGPYTGTPRNLSITWTTAQNRQHFDAWAIVNSPLILGFDLRNATLRDRVADIITNRNIIELNQDPLGIAGRRFKVSTTANPRSYITGNRVEAIAKPLANGDVAVYFGNWSGGANATMTLNVNEITSSFIGDFMTNKSVFTASTSSPVYVKNLNTGDMVATLTNNTTNVTARLAETNDSVTFLFSKRPLTAGLNSDSYFGVGLAFDQIDFVGGKIQVGTSDGTPNGTPIYHQNRANGLATINNNTGVAVNAAIKLDLYNAKGALVWSKTGPTKTVEPDWLYTWEYKEALPDIVVGYSLTATLIDPATGAALAPSYTRYAAEPKPDSIELNLAGGVFSNPAGTSTTSSVDPALVATNPVTAKATVYNDTDKDKKAFITIALYNANGSLADYVFGGEVVVLPEDNVTFSETYFLPANVAGKTVKAFLWDADTYVPLANCAVR